MSLPAVKTILYTTTLDKHTRPVFRQAIKLASLYNAKVVMLHVVEPIGEMGHALIQNYLPQEMIKKMHDEGIDNIKKTMQERVAKACAEELNGIDENVKVEIEPMVVEGNYTDAICDTAAALKADLIVMGSHNSLGRSSATTRHVIKYSGRPVLVVPTHVK
ncbi:MAG TPA: universal stress protein [Motiliproteus sp.]